MPSAPPNITDPASDTVRRAGEVFSRGGLVVFPTETVYGIGAAALVPAGLKALRQFKQRPDDQPFTIHLPHPQDAFRYVDDQQPLLRRLIRKLLPGPVTLIVDVPDEVIRDRLTKLGLTPTDQPLLWHENTVGLRCPEHELGQRVLASVPGPIVASSANPRGGREPLDAAEAAAAVGQAAELVVDGGHCRYAKPSTIIRVRLESGREHIAIEREGVFDQRYIKKLLHWTILLVCSGNTCRSPMAAGIARQILAQRCHVPLQDLEASGISVVSAGVSAVPGAPASDQAVQQMAAQNIDIAGHRSLRLTADLIHEADLILAMEARHRDTVLSLVPSAVSKTYVLDASADVVDPVGGGAQAYARAAQQIRQALVQRLKEQGL